MDILKAKMVSELNSFSTGGCFMNNHNAVSLSEQHELLTGMDVLKNLSPFFERNWSQALLPAFSFEHVTC